MSLDPPDFPIEEIENIANLAQLELTAAEKALFAQQFGEILAYFKQLAAVDTSTVEATAHDPPRYRADQARPSGISPADFSPYLEHEHYKVPRVIE